MAYSFTSRLQSSINYENEYRESTEYCLSLPFATEKCPFGPDTLAMEIGGRMFCLMALDGQWDFYNLKVAPDYGVELCDRFSGIRPGYHMNKTSLDLCGFLR